MSSNETEIAMITSSLAKIFRYSIKGDDEVELLHEIDIIKAYVPFKKVDSLIGLMWHMT